MEWNNGAGGAQPVNKPATHGGKKKVSLMNLRTASVGLVVCIALLIAAVAGYTAVSGNGAGGSSVKKDRMQAVFLNGGQVYFGKITDVNAKNLSLSDIYYLRVNQTVQPNQQTADQQQTNSNDISLVKLGCELHGPEDSMVINQEQVIFWENLKTDGQVAKAVATYKQQNPNGQKCDTATGTGTSTNGANTTNNTGTGTSNTPATNNKNTTNTPTTR